FGFGGKKARVRATVRASLWTRAEAEDQGAIVSQETSSSPPPARGSTAPPPRPEPEARRPPPPPIPSSPAPRGATTRRSAPGPRSRPAPALTKPPTPELVARSKTVLADILTHIGVTCTVQERSGEEPGTVVLDVSGDTSGLLIGRRGQTLDALEYMLNRI